MHQNVAICLYVSLLLRTGMKNGVVFEAPSVAYIGNYHTNVALPTANFDTHASVVTASGMP